ncbi:uncharacterized protein [Parasteatoda tepidariorum]|uniref:uncharacterized protein n=1 Tax=Parasteatoda tepidariorum TaxID=114398 RepID=UPI0039BCE6FE
MYSNIYPTAAKHLKGNIFMDDFVVGVDSEIEAKTLFHEMQELTSLISLPLAKWSTNSQVLKNEWKKEKIKFKSKTQVLGVHWDTEEDSFHQNIKEHDHDLFKEPITKRLLLKTISKIFDPLGIFSPSTVIGKILFQDTWLCGIEWDELLPPSIASRFSKWIIDLPHLNNIRIPRWIGISSADVSIHVFCDASERAYGTVLYVRFTEDTKFHVRMVCSRNRLSPLKRITLPRLELLAALMGARLLHYFCTETKLDRNTATLWSDSTVALNWIQENLIRLGGRLQFVSLKNEQKHPLLLDGSHPFVHLFIYYTHVKLHRLGVQIVLSEIRSNFWIIRGREAIKRVFYKCLPCKLSQASRSQQIEAPLPRDRITPCLPFTTIGIDFAGPLYVRNLKPLNTAYIALFTCSTTRAVHIELVSDLTTDKFLMALKRFAGRRGVPHTIYTDNATTFHAANKELSILWDNLTSSKVQQYYGRTLLDEEGLSTALVGVEAALNSRPLVYEQGNDDPEETLTPSHFLTGNRLTTIHSQPAASSRNLTKLYKQQQDLLDAFWKKWSKDYLLQLRSFHQVRNIQKSSHVRVGDIVLLHEDVRPRHAWKRALVTGLIKGRDGKVRTCSLRCDGKEISRPVQLIIPLEVDQGGEDVPDADASA